MWKSLLYGTPACLQMALTVNQQGMDPLTYVQHVCCQGATQHLMKDKTLDTVSVGTTANQVKTVPHLFSYLYQQHVC